MTWALILESARQVAGENAKLRSGGWQLTMGESLHGKTLGVLGLGNVRIVKTFFEQGRQLPIRCALFGEPLYREPSNIWRAIFERILRASICHSGTT
jgi:hypothetical protein